MTTILCIRKNNEVVMAGDGQATLGETVIFKSKSVKVRRIGNGKIIAGFAGAAADGITLIERLEEPVLLLSEYEIPDETELPDFVTAITLEFTKTAPLVNPFLKEWFPLIFQYANTCLLYTSPSPRD